MSAETSAGVHVSLADLARLEPLAAGFSLSPRQPVHSLLSGRHASRLRGRGLDFEELRNYRPGDDVRTIDWRATQRSGRAQVRVFTEERDRPVLLVVDQRRAMFFGSRRSTKSVAAAEVAALGAWRALRQGDRVGGLVFGDERETELRPHRSRRRLMRLLDAIVAHNRALRADAGPPSRPERLNEVLRQARRLAAHDHLVLLVTDFDGADEETREHVARLAHHNDVLAAFVHDPLEARLPAAGPLLFGAREEQLELDTSDRRLRERFGAAFAQRAERLRDELSGRAVPVVPIDAAEPVPEQVRRHIGRALAARRRRR